ncbi:MAG: hypothetical protein V1928_03300 [Parcubacteria group bacterium]
MATWAIGMELEIELIKEKIRCNAKVVDYDSSGGSIVEAVDGEMRSRRFREREYIVKKVFNDRKRPVNIIISKWKKKGEQNEK